MTSAHTVDVSIKHFHSVACVHSDDRRHSQNQTRLRNVSDDIRVPPTTVHCMPPPPVTTSRIEPSTEQIKARGGGDTHAYAKIEYVKIRAYFSNNSRGMSERLYVILLSAFHAHVMKYDILFPLLLIRHF
jgi:hypothetical protein